MRTRVNPPARRARLIEELLAAGRSSSTATVLFHTAIAARLGLNPSDHKCADVLFQEGPMTATELAERVGLTTAAITGVADRLERAGWVRREPAPNDRRRIIIRPTPTPGMGRAGAKLFDSFVRSYTELLSAYSEEELALLLNYIRKTTEMVTRETTKLREVKSSRV
jgi:DNA-binding MarR family transcriptional regulator